MFKFHKYWTKMIVFTIGLSTLPIVLLGLFFYIKTSETIQQKVNEGNVLILDQTRLRIEQVLGALDLQIERLADSNAVTEALNAGITPSQFMLVQSLLKSMSQVHTFDVSVRDVHLVDLNRGWILNSSGLNPQSAAEAGLFSRYVEMGRNKFWIPENESVFRYRNGESSYAIHLIKKIPDFADKPSGMLIIEIAGNQLRNYLAKNNTLGQVVILDEAYNVLSTQNELTPTERLNLETLPARLRGLSEPSGLFETSFGSEQAAIAYQRSAFNGWMYVSVIPIDVIRFESRRTGWIIMATCILMLLLAVLLSLAGSQRMYSPIQRLYRSLFAPPDEETKRMDEFHLIHEGFSRMRRDQVQMADQLRHHQRQLEEYYVLKLIRGEIKPAQLNEKLEVLGLAEKKWKRLTAMTIQMDKLQGTKYSERDSDLLLFAIGNMVGDLIAPHQRLLPIVVQSSLVTLLLDDAPTTEEFRTHSYSLAKKVQEEVERYLSLRISVGLSRSYGGLKDAHRACKEAMDALKYRVIYGQKTILHIEDVQPMQHYVTTEYPKELERQLLDAVKTGDRDKVYELLDLFFEEMSGQYANNNDFQIAVTRFFVNLIRLLQESGTPHLEVLGGDPPLLEQLLALSSVDEVRQWFGSRIIDSVVGVYEEQRRTRHQTISKEVVQLIHDHYDTDISLESCSNLLNYHPSYISKVIRQELGISFSDYLLQFRLERAKEMLEETDMKISEIAKKLQYNNSQNFIRSFRKMTGTTPGAYREHYLNASARGTHGMGSGRK